MFFRQLGRWNWQRVGAGKKKNDSKGEVDPQIGVAYVGIAQYATYKHMQYIHSVSMHGKISLIEWFFVVLTLAVLAVSSKTSWTKAIKRALGIDAVCIGVTQLVCRSAFVNIWTSKKTSKLRIPIRKFMENSFSNRLKRKLSQGVHQIKIDSKSRIASNYFSYITALVHIW